MINYILIPLVLVMFAGAISIIFIKDLIVAVIVSAVVDLITVVLFFFLQAPDVAITQASIVVGLTTFIFVVAIMRTTRKEEE